MLLLPAQSSTGLVAAGLALLLALAVINGITHKDRKSSEAALAFHPLHGAAFLGDIPLMCDVLNVPNTQGVLFDAGILPTLVLDDDALGLDVYSSSGGGGYRHSDDFGDAMNALGALPRLSVNSINSTGSGGGGGGGAIPRWSDPKLFDLQLTEDDSHGLSLQIPAPTSSSSHGSVHPPHIDSSPAFMVPSPTLAVGTSTGAHSPGYAGAHAYSPVPDVLNTELPIKPQGSPISYVPRSPQGSPPPAYFRCNEFVPGTEMQDLAGLHLGGLDVTAQAQQAQQGELPSDGRLLSNGVYGGSMAQDHGRVHSNPMNQHSLLINDVVAQDSHAMAVQRAPPSLIDVQDENGNTPVAWAVCSFTNQVAAIL